MSAEKRTILIIEDDAVVAGIYRSKFEKAGYEAEAEAVLDGQTGFYRVMEMRLHALMLDLWILVSPKQVTKGRCLGKESELIRGLTGDCGAHFSAEWGYSRKRVSDRMCSKPASCLTLFDGRKKFNEDFVALPGQ